MPKASPIQVSFNAGELSPQLKGRVDLDKYRSGCDIMLNFIPQIHGPARKRPGTRFIREVKNSAKKTRLIPFQFNVLQSYILEFGESYIRFHRDGGTVLDGGVPYEIATTYTESQLPAIHFTQSADVMYLVHQNHPPRKLSRFADDDWTIEDVVFKQPPFNDENTTDNLITSTGVTGNVTLTSVEDVFTADSVGSQISFSESIASKYDRWDVGQTISIGDFRRFDGNLYVAVTGGTTGNRVPVHEEGIESDGGVDWEYTHSGIGYANITALTDPKTVSATVVKRLPESATGGTTRYAFSVWSSTNGYPKAVCFFEDRLWFAGTLLRPSTLWASVTSDYENFTMGTLDDSALEYTINSQEVDIIEWLSPGKVLSIGTSGSEFTATGGGIDAAITPTNVRIVPQTTYGSKDMQPFKIAGSIIFTQRAGRKIRELTYSFESDSYVAPNMTILAEHITRAGVTDITYEQEPNQILWFTDTNGQLLGLTYERAEDVVGWHRHNIGGEVESIATVPHWDRDQDVTFMVVKRTINGSTVRHVEYIEKYLTGQHAFFVNSGLTYDGAPVTTLTGLSHLEGEEVVILVDGAIHPNRTVESGQIELQDEGSVITVGLPYTATLRTMPIEAGAADGVAQGKTMRINNLTIRLDQTGPGLFYGTGDRMDEYHPRSTVMNMDEKIPTFTGDTDLLAWPGEYETGSQITIDHRLPTPCTLVALMPQLNTYDR